MLKMYLLPNIASGLKYPRPKAGVFARPGPPLADNLRRKLRGEATIPFVPQRNFGSHTGTNMLLPQEVAAFSGYLWYAKDWIDEHG